MMDTILLLIEANPVRKFLGTSVLIEILVMTKVINGTTTSEPIHSQRNRPTSVDVAQLWFQNKLNVTI